jgi:hypothetical protein
MVEKHMDRNSIPGLVDMSLRASETQEGSGEIDLKAELQVNPVELDTHEGTTFTVAIKRLMLSLDLGGLDVVRGSRHGELVKDHVVTRERSLSAETVVSGKLSGDAGLKIGADLKPEINFSAGASRTATSTTSVKFSETDQHIIVRARGGMTWEVAEPQWLDAKHLEATYLQNDTLCKVIAQPGANAQTAQLTAYAKQKDLTLKATKKAKLLRFKSANHEKLLKVLIAKALSSSGSQFNGIVTFSVSETVVED